MNKTIESLSKTIDSYDDLVAEKQRLKDLLQAQRQVIREDIREIKEELKPLRNAVNIAGKFFSRDMSNPLLSAGAGKLIDVLLRKVLLARAGWFTKTVVPFLMKNYSSHIIDENKGKLKEWFFSLFKKKNKDGQKEGFSEDEEDLTEQTAPVK